MTETMSDGLFVGKQIEGDERFTLSPKRLRTHGVVVGMTGSGKTGLCLVLLEELVRAGVPIIAIDPKGDLQNLGLVFPELGAGDFAPWAAADADPAALADRWKTGLGGWGLGTEQVAELRSKMDFTVYTPGSEAGVPIDLLGAFERPSPAILDDPEARRDLVSDTVLGLLQLVGHSADPFTDPAHVVLSRILDDAWAAGAGQRRPGRGLPARRDAAPGGGLADGVQVECRSDLLLDQRLRSDRAQRRPAWSRPESASPRSMTYATAAVSRRLVAGWWPRARAARSGDGSPPRTGWRPRQRPTPGRR